MREFARPIVVVSRCLELEPCRYDEQVIPFDFLKRLEPHVTLVPVCPEVAIGLGVPREPIRIVSQSGERRLIQGATGRDLTARMIDFAERFLASLDDVDGFILKSRSPSCGIKTVKLYPDVDAVAPIGRTNGFFADQVMERFPGWAVEDEERLTNAAVREHFLTKLFTLAGFRAAKRSRSMDALVRFHTANKLLLMAYHQTESRILGRLVADRENQRVEELVRDYEQHLQSALARPARASSNVNVLMHGLGYFSECLTAREKRDFLRLLEAYRMKKAPLSAVLSIVKGWIGKFENGYLSEQTIFEPYPNLE